MESRKSVLFYVKRPMEGKIMKKLLIAALVVAAALTFARGRGDLESASEDLEERLRKSEVCASIFGIDAPESFV